MLTAKEIVSFCVPSHRKENYGTIMCFGTSHSFMCIFFFCLLVCFSYLFKFLKYISGEMCAIGTDFCSEYCP